MEGTLRRLSLMAHSPGNGCAGIAVGLHGVRDSGSPAISQDTATRSMFKGWILSSHLKGRLGYPGYSWVPPPPPPSSGRNEAIERPRTTKPEEINHKPRSVRRQNNQENRVHTPIYSHPNMSKQVRRRMDKGRMYNGEKWGFVSPCHCS